MNRISDTMTGTQAEQDIRGKVGDFVSNMKSSVYENAQKLRSKSASELYNGTLDYMKENPGKTLLVAFTAGIVLGSFLRRGPRE